MRDFFPITVILLVGFVWIPLPSSQVSVNRQRSVAFQNDDLHTIGPLTAKAHEDVELGAQEVEQVQSAVVGKLASAHSGKLHPETPGEKAALKQEIVKQETELLQKADLERNVTAQELDQLEKAVENGNIDPVEAARKLGESDAAVQEASATAGVGAALESTFKAHKLMSKQQKSPS